METLKGWPHASRVGSLKTLGQQCMGWQASAACRPSRGEGSLFMHTS